MQFAATRQISGHRMEFFIGTKDKTSGRSSIISALSHLLLVPCTSAIPLCTRRLTFQDIITGIHGTFSQTQLARSAQDDLRNFVGTVARLGDNHNVFIDIENNLFTERLTEKKCGQTMSKEHRAKYQTNVREGHLG